MLTWALIWWIRWYARGRLEAVRRVSWEAGWRNRPLGHGAAGAEQRGRGLRSQDPGPSTSAGRPRVHKWIYSHGWSLWPSCSGSHAQGCGQGHRGLLTDTVLLFNLLLLFIHSFSCLVASAFHLFLKMFLSLSPGFDPLCSLHPNLPNTQYLIQLTSCHQYGAPAAGSSNSKPNPIIWG